MGDASLLQKLDFMPSMDAITMGVLLLNTYVIYSNLSSIQEDELLGLSFEPEILAIQLSVLTALLYGAEFYADHKSDNGGRYR